MVFRSETPLTSAHHRCGLLKGGQRLAATRLILEGMLLLRPEAAVLAGV